MKCLHCQHIVNGPGVVYTDGVLHAWCERPHSMALRGLNHPCPKCSARGEIFDPAGTLRQEIVKLEADEEPECHSKECDGCPRCRLRVKISHVRVKVTCNLCEGEGYLSKPPTPVSRVVDWTL